MHRTTLFRFLALSLLLTVPFFTPAQSIQSGLAPTLPSASAAAYYYIAKPGELTMQVNVWGFVKNPGRYEVASSTDLIQLLSFAGGPVQYANINEVRIASIMTAEGNSTARERTVDLEDFLKLSESDLGLRPGDTIFIDHTGWLTVRDVFSVFTTVAIITSAIAQLIIASSR